MKIYLAYRFSGENFETLSQELSKIAESLESAGHSVFHAVQKEEHFQKNNFTHKQILEYSLEHLEGSDILLAYIKSPEKSEGMLLEIGFALAKQKPIYVAIKQGLTTNFVTQIAQQVITFNNLDTLTQSLQNLE